MSKRLQDEEEFQDVVEDVSQHSQLTREDQELLKDLIVTYVEAEYTREDALNKIVDMVKEYPQSEQEEVVKEANQIVREVLKPIESQRLYDAGDRNPLIVLIDIQFY